MPKRKKVNYEKIARNTASFVITNRVGPDFPSETNFLGESQVPFTPWDGYERRKRKRKQTLKSL